MAINPSSALRESGACRTALDAKVRSPTDLCIDNLVRGVLARRKKGTTSVDIDFWIACGCRCDLAGALLGRC